MNIKYALPWNNFTTQTLFYKLYYSLVEEFGQSVFHITQWRIQDPSRGGELKKRVESCVDSSSIVFEFQAKLHSVDSKDHCSPTRAESVTEKRNSGVDGTFTLEDTLFDIRLKIKMIMRWSVTSDYDNIKSKTQSSILIQSHRGHFL